MLSTGQWNAFNRTLGQKPAANRWLGWRLRVLVGSVLVACVGLFWLAFWLSQQPYLGSTWRSTPTGQIELSQTHLRELLPAQGKVLVEVLADGQTTPVRVEPLLLDRSARWLIDDVQRERYLQLNAQVADALHSARLHLRFADGSEISLQPHHRGFAGLGLVFWVLCALALVVHAVSMSVLMARPGWRNLTYAVMAWCQAGNLIFIAIESTADFGWSSSLVVWDLHLRQAFDLFTAAAIVQATASHPRRVPHDRLIGAAGWAFALVVATLLALQALPQAWWVTQIASTLLGASVIVVLTWSNRLQPHPFSLVLRRFGAITVGTWVLLSAAVAASDGQHGIQQGISTIGSMIWYVFFASLLLLIPFLSKSQQILREFSLLAAITTVATSLDLLFVSAFSLGQITSVTLALFVSLGLYVGARQWLLDRVMGTSVVTTERMFEHLYKIAREVEARPEKTPVLLTRLLRELFEPLEILVVDQLTAHSRVVSDGSTLVVPVPNMINPNAHTPFMGSIVIRFAHRGRRLFTAEDARLTDRIFEQLRRAVAFDKAVEQGRSEERTRLAQDLHDDIGARLLTMMYKSQSPEMEDYVRHTLQDLKTLTRGLAAQNHHLSDAAAEWKSDLSHRLNLAECELGWTLHFDRNVQLGVVEWSALTRVLRELANNAIAHSRATRVDVSLTLQQGRLELYVRDNGVGRNPQEWSHGLGLGGIRKRVKQLGGEVEWRELQPRGIECRVVVARFQAASA